MRSLFALTTCSSSVPSVLVVVAFVGLWVLVWSCGDADGDEGAEDSDVEGACHF